MKRNQRRLAQIIKVTAIVLTICAVVIFGYFYIFKDIVIDPLPIPLSTTPVQQNENIYTDPETANWETYTSQWGYSIKYPENLIYKVDSIHNQNLLELVFFNYSNPADAKNNKFILNTLGWNLESVKNNYNSKDGGLETKSTFTTKNFSGTEITEVTASTYNYGKLLYTQTCILIPLVNDTIELYGDIKDKELLEKIASTIKITRTL